MYTVCDVGDKETSSKGVHGHLLEEVLGVESEARLDGSIVGLAGLSNILSLPQLLTLEIVVLDGGKVPNTLSGFCLFLPHLRQKTSAICLMKQIWALLCYPIVSQFFRNLDGF